VQTIFLDQERTVTDADQPVDAQKNMTNQDTHALIATKD